MRLSNALNRFKLSYVNIRFETLKNTLQGVDSSTCNLQDTVDSIRSSSKSEKSQIEDLKKLNNKLSEFIENASRRDSAAEEEIKKSKEDFYTKYSYLKPECEKSVFEHIKVGIQAVCEWCKDNWKSIVKIVVAVLIVLALGIATVLTGGTLAVILAGAFWGALIGGAFGGIIGGHHQCNKRRLILRRLCRRSIKRSCDRSNIRSGMCRNRSSRTSIWKYAECGE